MLQNACYMFLKNETKQNDHEKKEKKAHLVGVEPRPLTCKGNVYP